MSCCHFLGLLFRTLSLAQAQLNPRDQQEDQQEDQPAPPAPPSVPPAEQEVSALPPTHEKGWSLIMIFYQMMEFSSP